MPLYQIFLRPDQRVKAQELKLPLWHGTAPPKSIECDVVYAHRCDSIIAATPSVHRKYRAIFDDKIEYWKGVVYMPRQREKDNAETQCPPSDWKLVSSKKSGRTFRTHQIVRDTANENTELE